MLINGDGSVEFFGRGVDTLYTPTQSYYLTVGNSPGVRIIDQKAEDVGNVQFAAGFDNVAERKERTIYASSILNGEAGNWFGPVVMPNNQTTQALTVYDPNTAGGQARLSVRLQGMSLVPHSVNVRFNNIDLGLVNFSGQANQQFEFDVSMSAVLDGVNEVKLQAAGTGDVSLVDTVRLRYSREFKAHNDRLRFTAPAGQAVHINGFSTRGLKLFEIQNGLVSARFALGAYDRTDGLYGFKLSADAQPRDFIVMTDEQVEQPARVQSYAPSNWDSAQNSADLVILVPLALRVHAQTLADRRQSQGLQTVVATVEDVYDEFGGGVYSPDAVKAFLQATTTWQVKPRYVVFFGDSSYDMRNYLGQISRDLLPTKLFDSMDMETSTDGWFTDFDNDGVENIAIGRLPVANGAEALAVLDKLARYDAQAPRSEMTDVFVSDSGFEDINVILQNGLPQGVVSSRIERSALGDSQMRSAIRDGLNGGPMVVTYTGHGSTGV